MVPSASLSPLSSFSTLRNWLLALERAKAPPPAPHAHEPAQRLAHAREHAQRSPCLGRVGGSGPWEPEFVLAVVVFCGDCFSHQLLSGMNLFKHVSQCDES